MAATEHDPVAPSPLAESRQRLVQRLMIFFGLVYFAQGLGQAGGLINQPLMFYLKSLGLTSDRVAQSLAILTLPWVIKPLYGLISDFIPLFGYRRKSYLFLMNALAAAGFLWLTGLTSPGMIVTALFLTALGIASSDVLVDALMVENGQRLGLIKQFQSQQWMWFNIAFITASFLGGWLAQTFPPASALHMAALITACGPAAVVLSVAFLVREEKSEFNLSRLRGTAASLMASLKSKTLWIVAGFLAFWNFTPSFNTPLYYHLVDHLEFSQAFIGQLGAVASIGAAIGAFVYRHFLAPRFSTKHLVYFSILLGAGTTLAYLLLTDRTSALILYFTTGILSMIPLLTLLSLAASVCPPQAAGFTFAALMSIYNAAAQVSAIVGAHLYERVFHQDIVPLIWVAAIFPLAAFLLVPFLPDGDGRQQERKAGTAPEAVQ